MSTQRSSLRRKHFKAMSGLDDNGDSDKHSKERYSKLQVHRHSNMLIRNERIV
jgi:hypothetical protein